MTEVPEFDVIQYVQTILQRKYLKIEEFETLKQFLLDIKYFPE